MIFLWLNLNWPSIVGLGIMIAAFGANFYVSHLIEIIYVRAPGPAARVLHDSHRLFPIITYH